VRIVVAKAGRADRAVAEHLLDRGRQEIARAFDAGAVRRAGRRLRKGDAVVAGDVLEVDDRGPDRAPPEPEDGALEVVHEDAAVIAVSKPPGMPSHPLRAGERGTLANRLVARYPECASASDDPREGGLVHRLDAGTSGLLVAARDRATWDRLREDFQRGRVSKEYLALVGPGANAGSCDEPLGQAGGRAVVNVRDAREARTSWTVLASSASATLLRCIATTGRMHQIRAHLAHTGFPILGDDLYGGPPGPPELIGFFLHAWRVSFLSEAAPLPEDRRLVLSWGQAPLPERL